MNKNAKGYVFTEPQHPIVENVILERFSNAKNGTTLDPLDIKISDFDDCSYQMKVDKSSPSVMQVNMVMPNLNELKPLGANRILQKTYGPYVMSTPVKGYDISLEISAGKGNIQEVAELISNLKRNILAAPLEDSFDALLAGNSGKIKPMVFNTRKNEQLVIQPQDDRVNVYFSLVFEEETDAALADIFLQEFTEAKRQVGSAPSCKYDRDIPQMIRKMKGIKCGKSTVGFLMFSILKTHIDNGNRDRVITLLLSLRSYVHYHIKASKAHLHTRMRKKVSELLLVLNQAKPNPKEEKKEKEIPYY